MMTLKFNPINIDRFYVLPDNKAVDLLQDIETAQKNIDITIYSIGSTEILQALIAVVRSNSVNIRIICDRNESLRNMKEFKQSYEYLKENLTPDLLQNIQFFWSSPYFAISHQKTLLIDHLDSQGNFLFTEGKTKCYVLTGNLASYKIFTESETKFYSARDYYMVLESKNNSENIRKIYDIFHNDLLNIHSDISSQTSSLVYSNGIIDVQNNKHVRDKFPFISILGIENKEYEIAGNSINSMLDIINSATNTLIIGTQDVGNDEILTHIVDAAKRGVQVSVLSNGQDKHINDFANSLVEYGGKIFETKIGQDNFYHHAKYIIADEEVMLIGSTNFSSASIYLNRELSLITTSKDTIQTVVKTFNSDCVREEVNAVHMMIINNKTDTVAEGNPNPMNLE